MSCKRCNAIVKLLIPARKIKHANKYSKCLSILLLVGILFTIPVELAAADFSRNNTWDTDAGKKVIIVVADRLSISDFSEQSLPNLRRLAADGAIALMNTNTAGPRIPDNTYASIGAGARIQTNPVGGEAYNSAELFNDQPAGAVYQSRTDIRPQSDEVLQVEIAKILAMNIDQKYPNQPGALGMMLHNAGLRTAVLGNADTYLPLQGRQAALIAMDQWGKVDAGIVDQRMVKPDPTSFWGFSTDYQALWNAYKRYIKQADLLVIELGDTARVDEGGNFVMDNVFSRQRAETLKKVDAFIGRILAENSTSKALFIFVTPTPADFAIKDKLLMTPVIMLGPQFSPGLLTTPTTKRPGIVTSIDLAPTVLNYFGLIPPAEMVGQTLSAVPFQQAASYLKAVEQKVNFTYLARPTLVQGYVLLQILSVILAMGTIFLGKPGPEYMKKILLGLMAVPLSLLILPVFNIQNLPGAITITLLLTLIIVAVSQVTGSKNELDAFIIICFSTIIVILGDAIAGSKLIKDSTLGFDPMVGARFYGIGNEYMGVLLGALTIGSTALIQRRSHPRGALLILVGFFYLATTYILAAPNLGTNVGGTIAAIGGLGFTYLWLLGKKPSLRMSLVLAAAAVLVVGGFFAYDISQPVVSQSHIGRVGNLIWQNGLTELIDVIQRKLAVNYKLIINITIWARVLLVSIVALGILFYRPVGVMQRIRVKYPTLYIGFVGVVVGSLVALAFNDSGIVAAATMMIYCSAPLIYLVIQEHHGFLSEQY